MLPKRFATADAESMTVAAGISRAGFIVVSFSLVGFRRGRCAAAEPSAARSGRGSGHLTSFAKTVSLIVGSSSSMLVEVTTTIGTRISFSTSLPARWSIIACPEVTPIR